MILGGPLSTDQAVSFDNKPVTDPTMLVLLVAISTLCGWISMKLKIPAGWLTGPFFLQFNHQCFKIGILGHAGLDNDSFFYRVGGFDRMQDRSGQFRTTVQAAQGLFRCIPIRFRDFRCRSLFGFILDRLSFRPIAVGLSTRRIAGDDHDGIYP